MKVLNSIDVVYDPRREDFVDALHKTGGMWFCASQLAKWWNICLRSAESDIPDPQAGDRLVVELTDRPRPMEIHSEDAVIAYRAPDLTVSLEIRRLLRGDYRCTVQVMSLGGQGAPVDISPEQMPWFEDAWRKLPKIQERRMYMTVWEVEGDQ